MGYPGAPRRRLGPKKPTRADHEGRTPRGMKALASVRTFIARCPSLDNITPLQLTHMFKVSEKIAEYELTVARQRRA